MNDIVEIGTAEFAIGKIGQKIKTGSIGSCVVIVLYDEVNHIGGMVHAMLPQRHNAISKVDKDENPTDSTEKDAKYVDEAIEILAREVQGKGAERNCLKAKIVGGAKMFKILSGDDHGIGKQNIETARKKLEELEIPIDSEDTGGTIGRTAEFDLSNGLIDVSTKM